MRGGVAVLPKDEVEEIASSYAEDGFLCSESVLIALSRSLNIESEVIPRIATGFGAGIGGKGEVCGALTGGIMGLGLRFGRSSLDENDDTDPDWFAGELVDLFNERFGHIRCKKLLGLDLTRPEDVATYRENCLWETRCRELIQEAAGLAYDILTEHSHR